MAEPKNSFRFIIAMVTAIASLDVNTDGVTHASSTIQADKVGHV